MITQFKIIIDLSAGMEALFWRNKATLLLCVHQSKNRPYDVTNNLMNTTFRQATYSKGLYLGDLKTF